MCMHACTFSHKWNCNEIMQNIHTAQRQKPNKINSRIRLIYIFYLKDKVNIVKKY